MRRHTFTFLHTSTSTTIDYDYYDVDKLIDRYSHLLIDIPLQFGSFEMLMRMHKKKEIPRLPPTSSLFSFFASLVS